MACSVDTVCRPVMLLRSSTPHLPPVFFDTRSIGPKKFTSDPISPNSFRLLKGGTTHVDAIHDRRRPDGDSLPRRVGLYRRWYSALLDSSASLPRIMDFVCAESRSFGRQAAPGVVATLVCRRTACLHFRSGRGVEAYSS